ncbi:MAG: hypothetical protein EOP84_06715 [Verrucomicrobiaceae bacterium]|nr:MAG: hypothetical protein EOP84_06715 [Verrucomicrobiaceae bacterium]
MTLYGYVITKSDFTFTPKGVFISSAGKPLGKLSLTEEDKSKVDEYLNGVRLGAPKRADEEGYTFSISHIRDGKLKGWTFQVHDARESSKPMMSLQELKKRLEDQEKAKIITDPSDSYFQTHLLLKNAGETKASETSIRQLEDALASLEELKKQFPDWKKEMVDARIEETRKLLHERSHATP